MGNLKAVLLALLLGVEKASTAMLPWNSTVANATLLTNTYVAADRFALLLILNRFPKPIAKSKSPVVPDTYIIKLKSNTQVSKRSPYNLCMSF